MKALGIVTWYCISAMISAIVQAWTMTKLWAWFVAQEYGPGPSMGAWFGIATILGFVVSMSLVSQAKPNKEDKDWDGIIKESVGISIGKWIGCALILIISWTLGSVLGWVH